MKCVAGTFKVTATTAVDLYFGIGFVPDWVKLYQMNALEQTMHWTLNMMRKNAALGGIEWDDDGQVTQQVYEKGIIPWRGGNAVTAAQVTALNCMMWDHLDYSKSVNHDPLTYVSDITRWNLVTARTGHFDQPCNKTYVNMGSFIWISGKRYIITDVQSNGELAVEVTLSDSRVPSGDITRISNMYDMRVVTKAGTVMPAGFWVDSAVTLFTATGEIGFFEAGVFDK
jgi:hypothetical protein